MEKKEENKEKNKIFLLLFLLFMTLIMFSTTSYAWFSANRMVTIDTLNIKVSTVGGIDISADGINWENSINTEKLIDVKTTTYTTNTNQLPLYLEAVSTGGNVDGTGLLEMYYGITNNTAVGDDYYLSATKDIEEFGYGVLSNGNFIAFDIFLRTTSDKDLYLTTDSNVTYGGEDLSTGIENTFRIAFLDEGTTAIDESINVIQALKEATTAYIWEPNYDTHTENGSLNATNIYGINVTTTGANRLPYDGVITNISRDDNILLQDANATLHPDKFKTVNIDCATIKNRTDFTKVFSINTGITKYRIYVWIEGQDVDCENNAAIGDANLYLQLSTNPA